MEKATTASKAFSLSAFLPFYNEEENIAAAIGEVSAQLARDPRISEYEVIVVDDGSTDATARIAREMAAHDGHIRIVEHGGNRGYGAALKSGLCAARYEYVFFTDGDLQFDIGELNKLTRYVPAYDAVIGYRAARRDPFMRLVNAWGWNKLNRFSFGLKVRDIDCAFKLFKRSRVSDLQLVSDGAMLSAELLIRLAHEGVRIKEVPVTHLPRRAGSPTGASPKVILRAFAEWWRLYRTTDFGVLWHRQAARFALVGIANTLFDLAVYFALTRGVPGMRAHIVSARVVSFLAGSVLSFFLNSSWTFASRTRSTLGELVRFFSTVAVSVWIGALSMQFFAETLGWYDLVAFTASIACTFAWNFTMSKLWVFASRGAKPAQVSRKLRVMHHPTTQK